eukprot:6321565-Amphidinium_carterae.1
MVVFLKHAVFPRVFEFCCAQRFKTALSFSLRATCQATLATSRCARPYCVSISLHSVIPALLFGAVWNSTKHCRSRKFAIKKQNMLVGGIQFGNAYSNKSFSAVHVLELEPTLTK